MLKVENLSGILAIERGNGAISGHLAAGVAFTRIPYIAYAS